jgi:hypothetical protein
MPTVLRECDCVVLLADHPTEGLSQGDVGAVVYLYPDKPVVEVEFVNWSGETVALVDVPVDELRKLDESERMQSRLPVSSGT